MRMLNFTLATFLGIGLLSCSDSGHQATDQLTVDISSQQYRIADTIHFTVRNSGQANCELSSCNANLTYWLQRWESNIWQDADSINIGPCLAVYAPITLTPGQALTADLPLAGLNEPVAGQRRVRVMYRFSGGTETQNAYSSSFDVSD